jgi:CrcB protein
MHRILIVGTGGFVGAVLRYGLSGLVQRWSGSVGFPFGTLAVNVLGCLIIGILWRMDEIHSLLSTEARLFLMVGILGAFTTFSTFGNETLNLANDRGIVLALLNIGVHIVFGLSAVILGRLTVFALWR